MLDNLAEENVVEEILSIIRRGDILPYKLINKFLTLENGDTMYSGSLDINGFLGKQLKAALKSGNLTKNLCIETIGRKEEIHKKLLRILEKYSNDLINNLEPSSDRERISDNILLNQHTIILARDNIPMDENR